MSEETKVIVDRSIAEPPNAAQVLTEVCALLTRRGCALVHQPQGMILCAVTAGNGNAGIAIAIVEEIKPGMFRYKPVQFGAAVKQLEVH